MPLPVRVLFVDDEEPLLRAVERLMRGHGLEVYFESEPLRALEVVEDRRIEILVADHLMPRKTGVELLREAKIRFPHLLRVMMTASGDRAVAIAAVNEGGIERFIEKPWPPDELQRILLELAETALKTRSELAIAPNAAAAVKSFRR